MAFLETLDDTTVPFVPLAIRRQDSQVIVGFESIVGPRYSLEAKETFTGLWAPVGPAVDGTGARLEIPVGINTATKFLRLVAGP